MAKYGARESFWAPWADGAADTDATKLPAYGEKKTFGQLNKVTDTPNFSEGSLPGDDQIALYEKKFKDGTVDAESVFLPMADAAKMLGAGYDESNGMAHGDDDVPPYIGYGFLTHHVGKNGKYYQVVFYPKLKASPSAETYETRGDALNFATDKMSFHWESPACRKYKIVKDFDTLEAAQAYRDGLFAGTAAVPGLPAPAQADPAQVDEGNGEEANAE